MYSFRFRCGRIDMVKFTLTHTLSDGHYTRVFDPHNELNSFRFWCDRIDIVKFTSALVFADAYGSRYSSHQDNGYSTALSSSQTAVDSSFAVLEPVGRSLSLATRQSSAALSTAPRSSSTARTGLWRKCCLSTLTLMGTALASRFSVLPSSGNPFTCSDRSNCVLFSLSLSVSSSS